MMKNAFSFFRRGHSGNCNAGRATFGLLLLLVLQTKAHAQTAPADNGVDVYLDVATVFYLEPGNIGESSWAYKVTEPGDDWMLPEYDDTAWDKGNAGFGAGGLLPGDALNTPWLTNDIWLRRTVELTDAEVADAVIWGRYDDTVEVYVNGVLAASAPWWTSKYRYLGITGPGRRAFKPGSNLIAVHCHDTGGGRYVDLGFAAHPLLDMPSSGWEATPELAVFGPTVRRFMLDNVIAAGVLAVMKRDSVVVRRGFGWMERTLQTPVPPDAILRLASNDKVLTKGAVMRLIESGFVDPVTGEQIRLQTKVFPFFAARGISPPAGVTPDPFINNITIEHLLEHRSGIQELPWSTDLYNDLGVTPGTTGPEHNVSWIYSQPLYFRPGTQSLYSSAGFFLLRYLVHLVTGDFKSFMDGTVLAQTGTSDIIVAHERLNGRDMREPWYSTLEDCYDRWIYLENYFALAASAEGMVRYLRRYHLGLGTVLEDPTTGEWAPVPDNGWSLFYGAMAGTWSLSYQRRWDEINVAVIFNQVGLYDALFDSLVAIIENIPEDGWGPATRVADETESETPEMFTLYQNYPNPFNSVTTIRYQLPAEAHVEVTIHNSSGQRVRTLLSGRQPIGTYRITWNGRNNAGRRVASGVYVCRLKSGSYIRAHEMVLLR